MKKLLKALFVIIGLFAMFAPYEFSREENGDFVYKAWFLGISKKRNGDKFKYKIWFFNKPKLTGITFSKKAKLAEIAQDADMDFDGYASDDSDEDFSLDGIFSDFE